ncbi:Alpha/Beta hydrolase protein [Xylaria bambusicola]|uniref:Alpha/Beta hydrolase protein n=1 Tax=Xylaria bambusicola TaxID=326684 RepID=UPI002008E394|nr:Alpha/Beta hydrolase protein [Xylaria bambusicola]KAI0521374.1 Alpha/Beta hydrolase protein [Xylaria bambusicola]
MAFPGGRYFIEDKLSQQAVHHQSFEALWETKWKPLCDMGVYPFMYGTSQDFEPVVKSIIAAGLKPPYNWDEYASHFFAKAAELVSQAEASQERDEASELFMRASALYRIARFPAPRSENQQIAWVKGKEAALAGLKLQKYPMTEVTIPHIHAAFGDGTALPGYYHLPEHASPDNQVPLVIIFTGLDGYRTELAVWKDGWAELGVALLVVEIPGTGDNPGAPSDPSSPDRVWSSMFHWVGQQVQIDQSKIVNWGFSTGGYYSIRLAHTHPDKLKGVVALGGGCHHMFDPKWLDAVDTLEYPFDLAHTLCYKFGYGANFERFKEDASERFSLLKSGILDRQGCARLLLVNGMEDEIFPIDDYYLCLQHGDPKEVRFVSGSKHMGEPASFVIILQWLFKLLEVPGDVRKFLSTIPFKAKYLK